MLWKNYKYRWYDISDTTWFIKKFAMQNITKNATVRWNTYSFANSFGSTIWPRLAESRLYSFEGRIHIIDKYLREKRWSELSSVFHIEWDINSNRFYDLEWDTKYDEPRVASCMVYTPLEWENEIDNPVIPFSFELVSPDPRIYDPRTVTVVWWLWQAGAWPLRHILPAEDADVFEDAIACIHEWDRPAPMSIRVEWYVVNPKIFIIQDNEIKYFFKLETSTTDLFISNINTTSLSADERFVVTDNWLNVKAFRKQSNWWWPLFIMPSLEQFWWTKTSYVLVMADNYWDAVDNTVVTVSYRHTYSY